MSIPWRIYDVLRDFYQETVVYTDLHAPKQNLEGKVILITGGNAGLGKESARQLALMNPAKIIITARNMEKGRQAVKDITSSTGFKNIHLEHLDLCSMASINALCRSVLVAEKGLNVLMCNAGFGNSLETAKKTEDGFDEMFQGNNLGHFLLTLNLLPLLEASASATDPSRVIYLSSLASKFLKNFDINCYSNTNKVSPNEYYGLSKFMAILMARGVSEKVRSKHIVVNSCHPGTVKTDFAEKYGDFMQKYVFPPLYRVLGRPLDQGAATQVYLASAPEAGQVTGKYWSNMKVWTVNPTADNAQLSRQFVELCEELISKYKL